MSAGIDPQSRTREDLVTLLPRLRRFALRLARSTAEADDLVQDTYERSLTRLDQWQPGSRLDSWAYRIMQSIRFNQVTAAHRQRADPLDEADASFDGAEYFERRVELDEVRRAMARLPKPQREVLRLVCCEGRKYREAAAVLGVPIGTVMSRLAAARMALHRELSDDGRVGVPPVKLETVKP